MGLPNIQQLFPDRVFTECCLIEDKHYALHREEATAVRKAVPSRRNEFGAGRMCARSALESLGIRECLLARNADGSTAWPQGIVGAISHSDLWCGAAVARKSDCLGVGFDIETADRVTRSIARRVLTDSEMDWVGRYAEDESREWFTLIFSAKESIYKCLPSLGRKGIRFRDAEIIPHPDNFSFDVRLTDKITSRLPSFSFLRGRYLLYEAGIFTGIVLIK